MNENEDDTALMAKFGITCEPKMVYSYREHRYERLKDAVNFAKLEAEHNANNATQSPNKMPEKGK